MSDKADSPLAEFASPSPPPHPGELLKEDILPTLGLTQRQFGDLIDLSRKTVNQILSGKAPVTALTAAKLSLMLGNSPQFWLRLQAEFDIWHAVRQLPEDLTLSLTEAGQAYLKLRDNLPPGAEAAVDLWSDSGELHSKDEFTAITASLIAAGQPIACLVFTIGAGGDLVESANHTLSERLVIKTQPFIKGMAGPGGETSYLIPTNDRDEIEKIYKRAARVFAKTDFVLYSGVAMYPTQDVGADDLIEYATAAAWAARAAGKARVEYAARNQALAGYGISPWDDFHIGFASRQSMVYRHLTDVVAQTVKQRHLSAAEVELLKQLGFITRLVIHLDPNRTSYPYLLPLVYAVAKRLESDNEIPQLADTLTGVMKRVRAQGPESITQVLREVAQASKLVRSLKHELNQELGVGPRTGRAAGMSMVEWSQTTAAAVTSTELLRGS